MVILIVAGLTSASMMPAFDQKALVRGLGNLGVKYVLLWFVYLSFWWRLAYFKSLWKTFAFSYALAAFIHLVYCIIQRHYGIDWVHGLDATLGPNRFAHGVYRISGFVGHPLTLGYCQVLALTSGLYFYLISSKGSEKNAWLMITISSGTVLLLSGSRGPQAVALVGLLASIPGALIKKYWRWIALMGVAGFLLGIYLGVFARFFEILAPGSGGDMRALHWRVHWDIFQDHFFSGIGPGAFRSAISAYYFKYNADDNIKLAHNAFLQVAADYGIIGLVGVFIWISSWIKVAQRAKIGQRGFLVVGFVTVLGGLTQNNIQDSTFLLSLTMWTMVIAAHEVRSDGDGEYKRQGSNSVSRQGG